MTREKKYEISTTFSLRDDGAFCHSDFEPLSKAAFAREMARHREKWGYTPDVSKGYFPAADGQLIRLCGLSVDQDDPIYLRDKNRGDREAE